MYLTCPSKAAGLHPHLYPQREKLKQQQRKEGIAVRKQKHNQFPAQHLQMEPGLSPVTIELTTYLPASALLSYTVAPNTYRDSVGDNYWAKL